MGCEAILLPLAHPIPLLVLVGRGVLVTRHPFSALVYVESGFFAAMIIISRKYQFSSLWLCCHGMLL